MITIVFWDAKGILLIKHYGKGKAIMHPFWTEKGRLNSNAEDIKAVNDYFEGLRETRFRKGIGNMKNLWAKCVELEGDYVEI